MDDNKDPYQGLYYVFQFSPFNVKTTSKGMNYKVYSLNKRMMIQFLRQHRFPVDESLIDIVSPNDSKYIFDDIEELTTYTFGSNKDRSKTFNIVTSPQILNDAIVYVGDRLSAVSLFGNLVMEDSIPLVHETQNLIHKMPLGYILDISGLDDSDTDKNTMSYNKKKWREAPAGLAEQEFFSEGPDDSIIYETLFGLSSADELQPITLESYIESFVSILTDEFI